VFYIRSLQRMLPPWLSYGDTCSFAMTVEPLCGEQAFGFRCSESQQFNPIVPDNVDLKKKTNLSPTQKSASR